MHCYSIVPTDPAFSSVELVAVDPGGVLGIVHRLGCGEAAIMEDSTYAFSVRLEHNGMWCVFNRGSAATTSKS